MSRLIRIGATACILGATALAAASVAAQPRGVPGGAPRGAPPPGARLGPHPGLPPVAYHGVRAGGWYGGPRVGISIGVPLFSPYYYPAPYYYPRPYYYYPPPYYYGYPVQVPPAPPVVYIERSEVEGPPPQWIPPANQLPPDSIPEQAAEPSPPQAAPVPQPVPDWFFCRDSNAYYPYVRECASPWQRVPSQPPSVPR
jgi:hypothetical protein